MKKVIYLSVIFTSIMFSCKQKEDQKVLAENEIIYENALDVPVDKKLGVIINIDSLGFFNHNSQDLLKIIKSKDIINQLNKLNLSFNVSEIVKDKSIKILNDNQYKYDLINRYNRNDIPKDLVTNENIDNVDFDKLRENINQNDLLLVNVKSGLDYNSENKKEYIAKTYIYINILDLKNKKLKYSETLGGTKYIDEYTNKITTDYLEKMLKESLIETLDNIDRKY